MLVNILMGFFDLVFELVFFIVIILWVFVVVFKVLCFYYFWEILYDSNV